LILFFYKNNEKKPRTLENIEVLILENNYFLVPNFKLLLFEKEKRRK